VKITFGSDAHNLYEVGEFAPHLKFLDEIGYKGNLKDIMARID
jgi:histidinol phosphatase-like PHP family hydrolase